MKLTRFAMTLAALLSAAALPAQVQPAPKPAAGKPAAILPSQPPDVPAVKLAPGGQTNPSFLKAHEDFVKLAKGGNVGLLFLGDSITAGWKGHKTIWDKAFGEYKPANFGIGGDRTQHVLWRMLNGELEGIKPKAVVLMIGTNNSGSDPAEGIAAGIRKIVETIRAKSANTKILLLAIFPRGEKPNPQRDKLKQVNALIAKLDDGKAVHFLDFGEKFLQADGTITREMMPDFLHLSSQAYQIWADAITPKLAELMK